MTQPWLRTCPNERCQNAPWRPTPFARVTVGKRVFTALREVLPTDWVTDQMIAETLRDYQSMEDQPK